MSYIVSKERLLELLKAENECAEMYGVNIDDNEDFDFEDLAELALQDFEEF